MNKPVLIVMAAGMGSRYGGLKQLDTIGPNGECIIDYSIYDAINAGFKKAVFIIKKDIEQVFREKIGKKLEKHLEVSYVFQDINNVPEGFDIPKGRIKPWGTGHAVLSCRDVVDEPFAVINADDFYGRTSFKVIYDYLLNLKDNDFYQYCMVGYIIENTLTDNGHVSRGICRTDNDNHLIEITERTKIMKKGYETKYLEGDKNWITIPKGSIASLNMWGFTPGFLNEIYNGFPDFLKENRENILKAEYFLPSVVDKLIKQGKAKVKVLKTNEKWYGVTYKEDKPRVKAAVGDMIGKGIYPVSLWEDK